MRHLLVILLAGFGLLGSTGCSNLLDSCDEGESGQDRNACFQTACRVGESCNVSDRILAGSTVPFTVHYRDTSSDEASASLAVTSSSDVVLSGSSSCSPDCTWSGRVRSPRAGAVTIEVNESSSTAPKDSIDVRFVRAATLVPSLVHDGFTSDADVSKDEAGVAQAGVSETDMQLRLLARDDGGHELRVHTGGYQITSTPARVVTASELSSVTPKGDTYKLRFAGPGDVVLHVQTLNDDQPLTVDVPLHIAR